MAFASRASNLVPGDTNGMRDVFVRDTVAATTVRVNVATDGTQANGETLSDTHSISADGRLVAFTANASNLVPGDTNGYADIFVRDREAGTTSRVSVASGGSEANAASGTYGHSISADGRYVAFESWASNLVPGDTNANYDTFVRGPLFAAPGLPFAAEDVRQCLRIGAGLLTASPADAARLNVDAGNASANLLDAARIARKVAGLEANP